MINNGNGTTIAAGLTLALAMAGCGGGTSATVAPPAVCSMCTPNTVGGLAAAGAALKDASVTLFDSKGAAKAGSISASTGVYTVDVSGMSAPFIVRVAGFSNGSAVVVHAPVLAADVGKNAVNVTPLSELIVAYALGAQVGGLLERNTVDYGKLTTASIASAETKVELLMQEVLATAGVAAPVDLRTQEFSANHTGLDRVLDAIQLVPAASGYELSSLLSGAALALDPAAPPATALHLSTGATASIDAALAAAGAFQGQLDLIAAKLKGADTSAAGLADFFAAGFLHTGLDAQGFIAAVLSRDDELDGGFSLKGGKLDSVQVTRVIDADNLEVRFRVVPATGVRPWTESMALKKVAGAWRMKGDGHYAMVGVDTLSRLLETPASKADILALSGVSSLVGNWEGASYTYYRRPVLDGGVAVLDGGGAPLYEWLSREGEMSFGTYGWVGDEQFAADRLARRLYTQRYSKPDTRVSNYIRFNVNGSRVSAAVASVTVTGPGLPAGGLTLVPPPSGVVRDNWVYLGDAHDWEAFNTERCLTSGNTDGPPGLVTYVPDCKLDWNAISSGSAYSFTLKRSDGSTLETLTRKLAVKPADEATLFQRKNELFPQFNLALEHHFEIKNLYNDVDGPFKPGNALPLAWINPSLAGASLKGISFGTEDIDPSKLRSAPGAITTKYQYVPLFGKTVAGALPTTQSFTITAAHPIKWAWATISSYDIFGNERDHQVTPANPY